MGRSPSAFITPLPTLRSNSSPFQATTGRRSRRPRATVSPRRLPWLATAADHYKVLDVSPAADAATIKRAYRRAALKNHPDVSKQPDARERFMRIQQAYAVLSDASKRASYDRQRASSASSAASSFAKGFGFDFDAAQYAGKWRQHNPMPEDMNDNLGNIFSDLFSGLAGAVGPNGVVEDFVDFLEKRVDGFASGGGMANDDAWKDVLNSSDVDVLETEVEDAKFVLRQLRARKKRVEDEAHSLRDRAREWQTRARRAEERREYDVRDAAAERERELRKDARRFAERAEKAARMIGEQEARLRKIEERLQQVGERATQKSGSSSRRQPGGGGTQQAAIDDELDKMKRELGL